MHEVTLVRDLLSQVKQIMLESNLAKINAIHISIGPLAGVDPLLVEQAYDLLKHDTEFETTRLLVDQATLMALCRDCRYEFEVVDFRFLCPECASRNVQVIRGDQMQLLDITADCNPNEESPLGINEA